MWNCADLEGDVMSVTLDTGERVYCAFADAAEEEAGRSGACIGGARRRSGGLLARPISALLADAEDAAVARALLSSDTGPASMSTPATAPGNRPTNKLTRFRCEDCQV